MGTTVWVDDETREKLRRLQDEMGTGSVNETIRRLIDEPPLTAQALFVRYHDEIQAILDKHKLYALVAFGSRARGDARSSSDLDLSVRARADSAPFAIVEAERELAELLGIPVTIAEQPHPKLDPVVKKEGVAFA